MKQTYQTTSMEFVITQVTDTCVFAQVHSTKLNPNPNAKRPTWVETDQLSLFARGSCNCTCKPYQNLKYGDECEHISGFYGRLGLDTRLTLEDGSKHPYKHITYHHNISTMIEAIAEDRVPKTILLADGLTEKAAGVLAMISGPGAEMDLKKEIAEREVSIARHEYAIYENRMKIAEARKRARAKTEREVEKRAMFAAAFASVTTTVTGA